jgi:hypothetical protein
MRRSIFCALFPGRWPPPNSKTAWQTNVCRSFSFAVSSPCKSRVSGLCGDCVALLGFACGAHARRLCGVWGRPYLVFSGPFFEAETPERAGFFRSPDPPRKLREREISSRERAKFSVSDLKNLFPPPFPFPRYFTNAHAFITGEKVHAVKWQCWSRERCHQNTVHQS